jgi:hypothetical protein
MTADDIDPYQLDVIRTALTWYPKKVWLSVVLKRIPRLGDCASIGLIKAISPKDLSQPGVVRDLLPIIRDSFADPQCIQRETDKKPSVTLLFLSYLEQQTTDASLRQEIRQTAEFVRGKCLE